MWFHTPAVLVDLFRRVNPQVDLVSSDPVMDELRMVAAPDEIKMMRRAKSIAGTGMDRVRELLAVGANGHDIATGALYAMMKAGAEGTSSPIYINAGLRSAWLHGGVGQRPIEAGDLVVVDLTPQVAGYCANLARTFVVGEPSPQEQLLLETYLEMREKTRQMLRPGVTVGELDATGADSCASLGLGQYHINGISHGIGLRFEENPASTIIPAHRRTKPRADMTVTIGHTVLAMPGVGGVRFEHVYRVTDDGGAILHDYPIDPRVN